MRCFPIGLEKRLSRSRLLQSRIRFAFFNERYFEGRQEPRAWVGWLAGFQIKNGDAGESVGMCTTAIETRRCHKAEKRRAQHCPFSVLRPELCSLVTGIR